MQHGHGAPPLVVEVSRGGRIESRHEVRFAVADPAGRVVRGGGDAARPIFPRSAIKPLQAIPLVESGAADCFGVGDAELALASASHSGEPRHTVAVRAWLERIGCTVDDLECGVHPPYDDRTAARLVRAGERPTALHNNCSGKHAGMLTLARHLGAPTRGYIDPGHPVQQRIAEVLAALAGLRGLPDPAIDGCGVPTWPVPLGGMARAAAGLAAPGSLPPERRHAVERLVAAIRAHPDLVAGSGRPCTRIMAAVPGVVVKTGAEGVYLAALPAQGLGLALKVEDGAGRAAVVALLALLETLGIDLPADLEELRRPELLNRAGRVVGRIDVPTDARSSA